MSTRQLLNMALGAVALMFAASGSIVWNQGHRGQNTDQQIELAQKQQIIIQDLGRAVEALQKADDQETVASARHRVGQTVLSFDRNLAALAKGGLLIGEDGLDISVPKISGGKARKAVDEAVKTWRETGTPLADMAAGEFSAYSAAGQEAIQGLTGNTVLLMEQMGSLANALHTDDQSRQALYHLAVWASGILGMFLVSLILLRVRESRRSAAGITDATTETPPQAPRDQAIQLAAVLTPQQDEPPANRRNLTPLARPHEARQTPRKVPATGAVFSSPVDFDAVNATVNQMTVDMNTIASSSDKMQQAIDSVGHALQGMLYSLKEMSQDTAEGHKIVRGANNAASFTAQAAEDLVASSREMSQVVGRVTQLALRTRQVAAHIDAEALSIGQPGQAFTSVVATEVKGLAHQTSRATLEIENTVSTILTTARQYEESIGQIIKNISAINKVSQHLGTLMLTPPEHGTPGVATPLAPDRPQAAAAAPAPAPVPPAPAEIPAPPADAPDPFAQAPDSLGEPAVNPAPAVENQEPVVEPEATVESAPRKSTPAPTPAPEAKPGFSLQDEDDPPAPTPEDVAEETSEMIEELGMDDPAPQDEPADLPVGPEQEDLTDPVAEEPAPPAPKIPSTLKPTGSNGNVFMLNKPKHPLEFKVDQAPDDEPSAPEETPTPLPNGASNIYDLPRPDLDPEQPSDADEEPNAALGDFEFMAETVPPDDSAANQAGNSADSKTKPTVFMLDKSKKQN